MSNFDSIFDEFFTWGFGKPRNLHFQTKTKDMMPSFWEKSDDGYKVTCRTVGISPSDVKVSVEDDCIHVNGETEIDKYKYSTDFDLPVSKDVISNIKNIKYKTENGITIIYLDIDRPEKKKINIQKL
jgi:HSP20 family molecular chaperone IbpA